MTERTLREQLQGGETAIGTFQILDSPMVAEIAGLAGMDFTILDQEHGPLTAETALALCAAAERGGASPVVRVRENAEPEIQRALDVGAAGVEIPQIETPADAEAAVEAARFDPVGGRGLSPYVRAGGYKGGDDYTDRQNERVTVIVHIEGEAGVENLDEIATVEGIDVLFLGPYDLSQSLGIPGQVRDERVEKLMTEVCDRAADAGKIVGTYADDTAMARRWMDAGAQYVAVYVDAPFLLDALTDARRAVEHAAGIGA
jgi:4-hydroxy-2-oxoheptanedioate aldolase